MLVEMFKGFCIFLKMFILLVNIEHLLELLLLETLPYPRHLHYFLPCLLAEAAEGGPVLL